ncbi:hypothetical protein EDC18_102331 [Natranaerovirga pectinivora]|uniref:Uncharacterized protein n=1 Tax=Natranaerovirga pectinivora TaxID=682400 RepID=A0A4R3MTC9_9FIRM|nr:hypothetical protein [Natranaerovirga pectinivora]TCT16314.1 hypothetical protein EDC18_102331 [Natranaerovirga pectinivora]
MPKKVRRENSSWNIERLQEFQNLEAELEEHLKHFKRGCPPFKPDIFMLIKKLFFMLRELLEGIDDIQDLLEDENFGLEEIKTEVANIESIVEELDFDFDGVTDLLEDILELLEDENFGLAEIKTEVANIESIVEELDFDFEGVTDLLEDILELLEDEGFGLAEIKTEVANIESIVEDLDIDVLTDLLEDILELLEDEGFGLAEIKTEVANIESIVEELDIDVLTDLLENILELLEDEGFGLAEIKTEVANIESIVEELDIDVLTDLLEDILELLEDEGFGLEEIKTEVANIEDMVEEILDAIGVECETLSTGPVIRQVASNNLLVQIANRSGAEQEITIEVYDLEAADISVPAMTETVTVPDNEGETVEIDITLPPMDDIDYFEVQVPGIEGVTYFISTSTGANVLQPSNTFRHSELICVD